VLVVKDKVMQDQTTRKDEAALEADIRTAIRAVKSNRRRLNIKEKQPTPIGEILKVLPTPEITVQDEYSQARELTLELGRKITGKKHKHVRLPLALISTVDFQQLTAKELRVLIVLHQYRDNKNKISRPGFRTIIKGLHNGLDIVDVPDYHNTAKYKDLRRQVRELKLKGFVLQTSLACRGRVAEYFLATNEDEIKAIKEFYNGDERGS
jgi:hypothetical protein